MNCSIKLKDRDDPRVTLDSLEAVQQLVGNMIIGKIRYGVLTTYEDWWVVELRDTGHVYISEAYCWTDSGECSVLSMLHYLVHLARKSSGRFSPPSLPKVLVPKSKHDEPDTGGAEGDKENSGSNEGRPQKGGGSSSGSNGKGGKGGQPKKVVGGKSACDSSGGSSGGAGKGLNFVFVRFLAANLDRITFQARLEAGGGRLAAIKAYDTEAARDLEAARFRLVEGVRGFPRVVRERLELEWTEAAERRVHAFVLEWVGPVDEGGARFGGVQPAPLPVSGLVQVRESLVAMHRRGVAHGDVREDNLAWDAAAGRAYVLDLSLASARGEAGFASACQEDLCSVGRLLADARARAARVARLMR